MYNKINITFSREQADALCTVLSVLEKGSELQNLYRALQAQFPRPYLFRLAHGENEHDVYGVPLVKLMRKGS